ncbi:hypothetical protein B0H14DRAFT_2572091 [Mycena olivaceomarginata]|nr:hypothetical protein B0H14DRAFT_2572091 [Mycena olivaceomarginata]
MFAAAALPDLRDTFGALYIGVVFAALFQGILTVQAYIYYESFPQDPWGLKSLVAVVCVPWNVLVVNWGDKAVFLVKSIPLSTHIILVAIPTLICQGFFLHRLWMFSKKNVTLIGVLTLGSIAVFVLDFYLTVKTLSSADPRDYQHDTAEIISMFFHQGSDAEPQDLIVATGLSSSHVCISHLFQLNIITATFMLNSRRNLRVALGTNENLNTLSTSAPVFVVSNQRTATTEEYSMDKTLLHQGQLFDSSAVVTDSFTRRRANVPLTKAFHRIPNDALRHHSSCRNSAAPLYHCSMESISTLRMLANIITGAVDTMEQAYTEAGMPLSSLDEPFRREESAETLRRTAEVSGAVKNIIAAAAQLTATVSDPVVLAVNTALAVRIATKTSPELSQNEA